MRQSYRLRQLRTVDDGNGSGPHKSTGVRPTRRHPNEHEDKVQANRTHNIAGECCMDRWRICYVCGAAHAVDCSSLIAVTSDSSTMTAADSITPPATIGGVAVTVPFCRVQGTARPTSDSEIKFEVWLPPTL